MRASPATAACARMRNSQDDRDVQRGQWQRIIISTLAVWVVRSPPGGEFASDSLRPATTRADVLIGRVGRRQS